MEETLGKRIAACRKALGLTQEALAERLGVTAQAVSKWENDLSCPDITMLPKLSEVFGVTTDELLGIQKEIVHSAEVVTEEEEDTEQGHNVKGDFELQFNTGKRHKIALALWVILGAVTMLLVHYLSPGREISLWDALWPTGLLIYGLIGLYPKFSVFRMTCALFGGYGMCNVINVLPYKFSKMELLAVYLLLIGLFLLVGAIRKPGKGQIHIHHDSPISGASNHFSLGEESFDCGLSFGENSYLIELPRLSSGEASLSFGEMILDLRGCQEIAEGCHVALNASFGDLTLLVPKKYKVEHRTKTAFAAVSVDGAANQDAKAVICVDGKVSFGHLQLKYI